MPKRRAKRTGRLKPRKKSAARVETSRATGLPAKDSVREVVTFISPHKKRYLILKTTETDAYDPPMTRQNGPADEGSKSTA